MATKKAQNLSEVFDRKLALWEKNGMPSGLTEAAIYVNDTLELAWASARQVFGDAAKPEHALAIYSLIDAEWPKRAGASE